MKFVVIAAKRTGSSHLVNRLSSHPDIFCHGNVFKGNSLPAVLWPNAARPTPKAEKKEKKELSKLRSRSPEEFLNRIFALGHDRTFVGFKIFVRQNDEILSLLLQDPSVRKLVLFRANLLANYASCQLALETGAWEQLAHSEQPEQRQAAFDEPKFLKYADKYLAFYRRIFDELTKAKAEYTLINYEAINDPLLLCGAINFIGADPNKPLNVDDQPRMQVKQGSTDILARFSNPNIVKKFLKKRDLLHWLHEGETHLDYMSKGVHDDTLDLEED